MRFNRLLFSALLQIVIRQCRHIVRIKLGLKQLWLMPRRSLAVFLGRSLPGSHQNIVMRSGKRPFNTLLGFVFLPFVVGNDANKKRASNDKQAGL